MQMQKQTKKQQALSYKKANSSASNELKAMNQNYDYTTKEETDSQQLKMTKNLGLVEKVST